MSVALQTQRKPLGELLHLALPTIAQMASYTVMQFADTLQLAIGAGDAAATAAGMGGFMVFAAMSWGWGAIMIVNTLVSQSIGAGNPSSAGRYLWQGIWFALGVGLLLLPTGIFSGFLLHRFEHSDEIVRYGSQYYGIEILWSPVRLAGLAVAQFLLAIGRPRVTLFAAMLAASLDILMNYVLISGRWGFPRMGVAGAAWSTNAAVTLELLIMAAYCLRPSVRAMYQTLRWRFDLAAMRQLIRIGIPGGFQIVAEVFAWMLFCLSIMNYFGQAAVTANNYMMQFMKMSFMPAFGLSAAVTALVGRYIGMGKPDIARQRAHLGFKVAASYMLICGVVFFLGRNTFISLFSDDPEVIRIGAILLTFAAIYQLFDALYIIYIGALRGAGDTFWPAWVTGILCWTIVVGGGAAMGKWFTRWGPTGPWIMASIYGIVLGSYLVIRFNRGRWIAINTADPSNEIPASTTVGATKTTAN